MNEKTPVPPLGDASRRRVVGGDLLNALDAALVTAWEDDPLIEAFCHDEGLVESVVNLELAIETLRSALASIERPDPCDKAMGVNE